MRVRFDGRIIYDWLTLRRRKTFRAKVVDLSTSCAVPGCPLLMNFEPYWIALQILSLASALFRYRTTRPSSARVASNDPIFLYSVRNSRIQKSIGVHSTRGWSFACFVYFVTEVEFLKDWKKREQAGMEMCRQRHSKASLVWVHCITVSVVCMYEHLAQHHFRSRS